MNYNLSALTSNASGYLGFAQAVNNELMSGVLFFLILLAIGVIMFLAFYFSTADVKRSVPPTMIILMVLGLILRAGNLVNDLMIFVLVIGSAISIAFVWRE